MLRSLQSMEANVIRRLIKSPKMHVRDSDLLLALLDVRTEQQLTGHPVAGALREGVATEQLIGAKPPTVQANSYRTARGAEGGWASSRCRHSVSERPNLHLAELDCSASPLQGNGATRELGVVDVNGPRPVQNKGQS